MPVQVVRPIAYGSMAFFLGSRQENNHTHRWSIYVRGIEDEDLSYFIKKVVFHLHPSCQPPVVVCDKPPYVATQTGWGEFDCKISLYFMDEKETSVELIHALNLYPPGMGTAIVNQATLSKKPVVCENYDEIVFNDPSEEFMEILKAAAPGENVSPEELSPYFTTFNEVDCMKALVSAQNFINKEIEEACQQLKKVNDEVRILKQEKKLERQNHAKLIEAAIANQGTIALPTAPSPASPDLKRPRID